MSAAPVALIGDGIENPWNARTMIAAAAMFGGDCLFRDRHDLAAGWASSFPRADALPVADMDEIRRAYAPLIALENVPGAASVFGARTARGARPALVSGNERRGIATDLLRAADSAVQIPLASGRLNTLNVAAASAVALYYLWRGGGGQAVSANPARRRPELLLARPADHVEAGSTIRSAGAFGWERVLLDDAAGVWFGVERARYAEGRAAARRHRNPIRIVPVDAAHRFSYDRVTVVTVRGDGVPLHRANLARGPRQLLVVPDESTIAASAGEWRHVGDSLEVVRVPLPAREFPYHYRLVASIVLAEAARQIGRRSVTRPGRRARHAPSYDRSVALIPDERGETVYLDDLRCY